MRNTPKLRFEGFFNAWEQRKVGTFASVLSASRVHKDEWRTEGVPFYRSSDVVSAFKGNDNERAFISTELYEELIKSSGRLEEGDILITGGGSIGIPYIVPNNEPLYSKDADLIWIKKSAEHDSQYLYAYFTSQGFREYISSISHVGTIAHYTIEQVKDTPVLLPSLAEQSAIGLFFSQLDTLITLHQRKCKALASAKQFYLQNMFPQKGETTPKIRFEGCTDAWEQHKLSDFAQRESTFLVSCPECPSVEYEDVVAEEGRLNKDIRRKETQKTGIAFDGTQVLYGKLRPYAGYYYTCVEQYMMAQKVFAGHRFDLFEKILRTADPAEMKRLAGKDSFQEYAQICSFWEKNRKQIVKRGVRAKFQQNAEKREELLSTGTALLCECAGQDRVWGVGITYSDPSWQDVSNWNGDNLLGVILMEVREELRISHIPYIGFQDAPSIPEWQLTAKHLKRIPQFYDAIHAYADQLPAGSLRNGFYSTALEDVEFSMRTNMGGGLPVAGFYEMKQEVYEVARKLEPNPKRYLSELFVEKPKHFGLRGDQFFWADLESMFAFVEAGTLSEEEFIDSIYRLHRKVTGKELLADQDVKVDKYAHGGMSSGKVSGVWWIKEGIPTLVERFVECQNK